MNNILEKDVSAITIQYLKADHIHDCFVSGVGGGVTPTGMIVCRFFMDQFSMPVTETIELSVDGKIGRSLEQKKNSDIIRHTQASVVFELGTAKEIIKWLQNQVNILEKRGGGKP